MTAKLFDFLKDRKIDERRLLVVSARIERLRPADRHVKLLKSQSKEKTEAPGQAPAKPRSGRPISPRLLKALRAGKAVSGPAKQRVLRAVNQILTQRKEDAIELRALF